MKNTPLSSIKIDDKTFRMLQIAVEKSGMDRADVLRWTIRSGLMDLEQISYDPHGAAYAYKKSLDALPASTLKSLPAPGKTGAQKGA